MKHKADRTSENFKTVFDLRALTSTMMLSMIPPVFPCSFAVFWKIDFFKKKLYEIPYFGRGRKMYATS